VKIENLIDIAELEREITAGYINRRFHPEFPELATIGYSDKCQYDNHWTPTTRAVRGIIYDTTTGEVLARPFAKFFNYGQGDAQYDLDAPILGAFNKFDGSLGIRYTRPDGRDAIATRGSFDSDQARHATKVLWEKSIRSPLPGLTSLYEIVYPENRIVLDYGDSDELIPLGAVDIETGEYSEGLMEAYPASTLGEVLAIPPRKNSEGWVVWLDATTAVKIKQEDYIQLHRIVSSLSVKEVWRQLRAGTFKEFATALPDEFHKWAKTTADELKWKHANVFLDAFWLFEEVKEKAEPDRKSQALWLKANANPSLMGYVFGLLDGKDIKDAIWRAIEPTGAVREIPTAELIGSAA